MIYLILFIFGTLFGSFGSVLVWRLGMNINIDTIRGILYGRSECPKCKNILGPKDLIPIFSYIFSKGKCRHCGNKISIFYPIIEIFTGLVFMFSYYITGLYIGSYDISSFFILNLLYIIFFNWILVLFMMSDFLFFHLNGYLWLFSLIIIILLQFLGIVGDFNVGGIGAIVFFIIFYLVYLFGKFYVKIRFGLKDTEGFGSGDVMIALWLGLLLPFVFQINNIKATLFNIIATGFFYLMISSIFGIIFAGINYIFRKGKTGSAIPFLPAMISAFWFILLFLKFVIGKL